VSPTLVGDQSRDVLADDEDDFESASQVLTFSWLSLTCLQTSISAFSDALFN